MTNLQKADAIMMFKGGRFSIKEVAAQTGVPEFAVGQWLVKTGALAREKRIAVLLERFQAQDQPRQ